MAIFGFGNKEASTPATPPAQEPSKQNSDPNVDPGKQSEPTGLDRLSNLLYPKKDGEGKGNSTIPPSEPIDPTKIFEDKEAIGKILETVDFTKSISPKTQQLLESNSPEGFPSMVNDISKAAFLEALKLSTHLNKQTINDAVERALQKSKGQINESLEDFQLNQAFPELQNPVIRLGLEAVKSQLKEQNPTMSSKDLAAELKNYLKEINTAVNPSANPKGDEDRFSTSDWEDWVTN